MFVFGDRKLNTRMTLAQRDVPEEPRRQIVFELILAVCLSAGCWFTFFSMFPSPVSKALNVALIVALPALLVLACRNRFIGRFLVFYVFLIVAVFFLLTWQSTWNGFLVMTNIIIEVLNNTFDKGLLTYSLTGSPQSWPQDTLLAELAVMLLAGTGIAHSVHNREPVLGFVLTCIPVLTGLILGVEPSVWLYLLLILSWICLLLLSAAQPMNRRKKGPLYITARGSFSMIYAVTGVMMVLLLAYVVAFSGEDYRPVQSADDAKAKILQTEEHLRYDNLSDNETDSLMRGDLTASRPLEYTENIALHLDMAMASPMHIRGFVGGYFEDGKWQEAEQGAYGGEYTGITEWLNQQGFYPMLQQDMLFRMTPGYDYVKVDVENRGASSKYVYLPYEAAKAGDISEENIRFVKDYAMYARGLRGIREYSFRSFIPEYEGYDFTDYSEGALAAWVSELKQNPQWQAYAENEAAYRRFVYDTYLFMDDREAKTLKQTGISACQGKTIEYTLSWIRKYFEKDFTYDVESEPKHSGAYSQLKDFLTKNRTGNDMYFATAGALMFRSCGIPARYVEGYYLSPDFMKLYTSEGNVKVDVYDSMAHAWVEIYIDEVGWFPVEVTPGFYEVAKHKTKQEDEQEELQNRPEETYTDEVPEESEEEKAPQEQKKKQTPLWLIIPAAILLLLAAYVAIRRRLLKRKLDSFGYETTEAKVYEMYSYAEKLLKFSGRPLAADPYNGLEEIEEIFGPETRRFVDTVCGVRFGRKEAGPEEHKEMAAYVRDLGRRIYNDSTGWKKFRLKYVNFYV